MKIILSNQGDAPIYEQIKEQIKEQILEKEIEEGEALPSIRSLAKDLRVSVITTSRAYTDLEQEGLVRSVKGKGYFVLAVDTTKFQQEILQELEGHIKSAVKRAKKIEMPEEALIQKLKKEWEYE